MKNSVLAILLLLSITISINAQEGETLIYYYDTELFKINFNKYAGTTLTYNNSTATTASGIPSSMQNMLSNYPDSKDEIELYTKYNKTGRILRLTGLILFFGGALYPTFATNPDDSFGEYESTYKVSFGLIIGGLASNIIGSFMIPKSYEHLYLGVNTYNRHKILEYQSK